MQKEMTECKEPVQNNPIALDTLTHMHLTQARLNKQSPDQQPWGKYSGLGFPVLNRFSGLGRQNPSSLTTIK